MNSILVYTFRTSKHLDTFKNTGVPIFVFGKLKEDFEKFKALILEANPDLILGLAEIQTPTRIESKAINLFGSEKVVVSGGPNYYSLYKPEYLDFILNKGSTNSFCNWTAYKISNFIESKYIKNSFIHFKPEDLSKIIGFINN